MSHSSMSLRSKCSRHPHAFRPSPTGFLHIGGARTALFCWLAARSSGGKFILRVEDTDRERSTAESVQAILEGLAWLELDPDEGPFYQSDRMHLYQAAVERLLDEGKAYRCYCSRERLEKLREAAMERGEKPRYDGHCRHLEQPPEGVTPVIRFRNPESGSVAFRDRVRGPIEFDNRELDDLVIQRADGTPTYNFAVVVDDLDMGINLVIRGDDHINNTPRQINLYHALNAEPPEFAHVPMILGDDGARLSKRHGAVGVLTWREMGYLPDAMLNYLARLGWSHGDRERFSRDDLVELFRIEDVNRKASRFDVEKLNWLNQHYLRALPAERVAPELAGTCNAPGWTRPRGRRRPTWSRSRPNAVIPWSSWWRKAARFMLTLINSSPARRKSTCARSPPSRSRPCASGWPIPSGHPKRWAEPFAPPPNRLKSAWARLASHCAWR